MGYILYDNLVLGCKNASSGGGPEEERELLVESPFVWMRCEDRGWNRIL